MNKQLWGGRFNKKPSELMNRFNASIEYDKRLWKEDIAQSVAHVSMLSKCGIISDEDRSQIVEGLNQISEEIKNGKFSFSIDDEDIHMSIERRLIELKGDSARKVHTARSRNDQVATDFRLFAKKAAKKVLKNLFLLQRALLKLAEANLTLVMPGFTHLQHAQPILVSHWIMAYYEMLTRDAEQLFVSLKLSDSLPLGAGALAGTSFPIDRFFVQKLLGFNRISKNSIDAVSDRDFALSFLFSSAVCGMHMSRLAEELILFATSEFGFIKLPEEYSTGSSMMPQKRNPDALELIRGKTGRLYGNLMGLFVVMKSLPLAYDKDMQEDKEQFFDSFDTINDSLLILNGVISKLEFNKKRLDDSIKKGFITATDLADYLAKKGVPFRHAHRITGEIVKRLESEGKDFESADINSLKKYSDKIDDDLSDYLSISNSISSRKGYGGTSKDQVLYQIKTAYKTLDNEEHRLRYPFFDYLKSPKPTVDAIVLKKNKLLLIKRKYEPFGWALPGGFIEYGESAETAVERELKEETGLKAVSINQFHTYSSPDRDERFHTISVVFIVEVLGDAIASDDAAQIGWFSLDNLPEIAFDHKKILDDVKFRNQN